MANIGVGFGAFGTYGLKVPPINVAVDYKLPIDLPITVGAMVTFAMYGDTFSGYYYNNFSDYGYYNYDLNISQIGIAARGAWHFNVLENLDLYAGLTAGWIIQMWDRVAENKARQGDLDRLTIDSSAGEFTINGLIGGRYFFTDMIGAYLEAGYGYTSMQFVQAGVTLKF
jgi:hypothetical protein